MTAQTGARGVTQRLFLDDAGLHGQQRIPYAVGLLGSVSSAFAYLFSVFYKYKPLTCDGTVGGGLLGEELPVARSDAKHRTRETMQGIVEDFWHV